MTAFLCLLQRGIKIRLNKMISYLSESPVFPVVVGWISGRSRLRRRAERCRPSLWKQQSLPSVAALLSSMCSAPKEVVWRGCLARDLPQEHNYATNAEMLFIDTLDRNLLYCCSLYCGMESWDNDVVTFLEWSNSLMLAGPWPGAAHWAFTY